MSGLEEKIGQLFIIGFPGENPSKAFLDFIKNRQIGGVILFEDNCPTHLQAKENIQTIRSQYETTAPFIAVDQEGGQICRLKGAPAEFRAASDYGCKNELEHFAEDYQRSALFMESLGINLNLSPVCDIFLNPANQCLKDRCFGLTAEAVAPFVKQVVLISRQFGLLSCLKHFPGLGAATIDPHHQTSEADYDLLLWEQREKIPFAVGVQSGADMIMTTHLRLSRIDKPIVTGSCRILSTMIRKSLSFDGPVITDDLTMSGATPLGNIGQRAVAAFNAGHDILLFGQDFETTVQAYSYFVDAVRQGEVPPRRIESSLGRIAGVKFKLDSSLLC
ncbi:MAG: glycoside hydrolase family 3 N-terminal domain-containing protein [Candidatus Zixiibacteriota bacterium]